PEPRPPAEAVGRGRSRPRVRAGGGEGGPRRRPPGTPRVLRPATSLHGRAGPAGRRLLLAGVRPGGVPAHLLRRSRRSGRRPPEGDQRPGTAAGRGRSPLPPGLRAPGDRPGWPPAG